MLSCVGAAATPAPPAAPPPPLAPPCTEAMLKARPAGDKNLPIACRRTTLGDDLSHGVFEEATFQAKKAIELNGTDLAHADVSGSRLTVTAENNDVLNQAFTSMVGLPRMTRATPAAAPPPPMPPPMPPSLALAIHALAAGARRLVSLPPPPCADKNAKKCKESKCKKYSKKKKKNCKKTCGLCEACEDNTIPGFPGADADLSWCKLNTKHAATDAARERFCAGDYGYKCKKSCDLCN